MLEIYEGPLLVEDILSRWHKDLYKLNYGAIIDFIGVVREEDNIEALSFEIHLPTLYEWFKKWQNIEDVKILMAHSVGEVKIHQTSFIALVATSRRKKAFEYIEKFVEDFKKNAPIWKYDIVNSEKIYRLDRASKVDNAGILKD